MATLKQKPNGIYFLDVRLPDQDTGELKRSRVSCDTRDKGEAEQQRGLWLAGRHPKHPAMGGVIAPKGVAALVPASTSRIARSGELTLARWLDRCLSTLWKDAKAQKSIRSSVKVVTAHVPTVLLKDVSARTLAEIEGSLRGTGKYAEGSIRKLLTVVSATLTYATQQEDPDTGQPYLAARPAMPTIKVRNVQDRTISLDEERAIFECIEARIAAEPARPWWLFGALLRVLFDTGFRLGEGLSLGQRSVRPKRWLDPQSKELQEATYLALDRYSTKNDKPREVPATRRVLGLVPALNAQATKGRWFPWTKDSSGPWYLWNNVREDMAKRGFDISDVRLHTIRHTCATRLAENGMDLLGLRDWLGHSDIKITAERYVHLMSSHIYRGAAILELAGINPPTPSNRSRKTTGIPLSSGGDYAEGGTPALH